MSEIQSPRINPAAALMARLNVLTAGRLGDREISNAALSVYTMRLGGVATAFLLQVVIAMLIGAESFGIFAFAWVLATTIGQFCCCGFNETSNRFLPAYIVSGDLARARGFVQFSSFFVFTVAAVVCLASIAGMVLARHMIPQGYFLPAVLALTCAPLLAITHLKETFSISRSLPLRGLTPTYVVRPLLLMVFVWGFVHFGFSAPGADVALGALLAAALISLVLQSALLHRPMKNQLGTGKATTEVGLWLGASLPLLFAQGFFLLATSLDVFVLSALVSPEQVGVYFAAAKIVTAVSFIQMAVGAAITRRLSEAVQTGSGSAFDSHFERGRAMMMWPTLAGVVLVSLASPLILGVFGPEFPVAAPVVVILSAGLLIQSVAGPIQERMMVMGQQRAIALIIAGSLAFNVIASIALTLMMGIIGAAVASALSIVLRITLMRIYALPGPSGSTA
jgi:O-antigen/teichoic acid export membrane protein